MKSTMYLHYHAKTQFIAMGRHHRHTIDVQRRHLMCVILAFHQTKRICEVKVEVLYSIHKEDTIRARIHQSNFRTVQREGHVFLMAASEDHNHFNHLPNCACSPSNVLITPAFHEDFITVVRRH